MPHSNILFAIGAATSSQYEQLAEITLGAHLLP